MTPHHCFHRNLAALFVVLVVGLPESYAYEERPYGGEYQWDETGNYCLIISRLNGPRVDTANGPVQMTLVKNTVSAPESVRCRRIELRIDKLAGTDAYPLGAYLVLDSPPMIQDLDIVMEAVLPKAPSHVLVTSGARHIVLGFACVEPDDAAVIVYDVKRRSAVERKLSDLYSVEQIAQFGKVASNVCWLVDAMIIDGGLELVLVCQIRGDGPLDSHGLPVNQCGMSLRLSDAVISRSEITDLLVRCIEVGGVDAKMWACRFVIDNRINSIPGGISRLNMDSDLRVRALAEYASESQ